MATTGFWPIKNSLKDVIDYAENPDKTTNKKYVDDDLYKTIEYASNDEKTDKKMFVSAINCNVKRAYERMMATKKRFGKLNGNVAYHGYQSFQKDEVTPSIAHQIGMETAKRMWGNEYEIVVTTHLNTDNIHNHIVINSVSFKTGKKFENHISDHYKLREISDKVCLEHGLNVLENSKFYNKNKSVYWQKRTGKLTHRDILKSDIEYALKFATTEKMFVHNLKQLGYKFVRENNNPSIIADDWKRAVRLSSVGCTREMVMKNLSANQRDENTKRIIYKNFSKKEMFTPLQSFKYELSRLENKDSMQVVLELVITLCKLIMGYDIHNNYQRPISYQMRREVINLDKTLEEYNLLCDKNINSYSELISFIVETKHQISQYENERNKIYNKIRRADNDEKVILKEKAKEITKRISPLRKELNISYRINEKLDNYKQLLQQEMSLEQNISLKIRDKQRKER